MDTTTIPFIGQVATQGVLGILLALSLFVNWYFIRKLQDINDKRVQDVQDLSNKTLEPINAIKQNSELLIAMFTKFLNNGGK